MGGSPWGCKESGTTEQLTLITSNRPSLLSEVKQYITLHVLKSRAILPFNPRKGVLKGARRCGLTAVRGDGKEIQEGGDINVYLWLIHVYVWQKPTQYCKTIILQ